MSGRRGSPAPALTMKEAAHRIIRRAASLERFSILISHA